MNKNTKMKKIFQIVLLFITCIAYQAKSNTWVNISSGYWDNPFIWQGGISPPCTLSDTIIINHPVAIKENILLNSNAYIFIDSTGGICGHHNITVMSGAKILKLGILEIDSLKIPGGIVNCSGNGEVILTLNGIISNGGSFSVNDCSLSVGPWFNCVQPAFAFTLNVEEINESLFTLFPNPTSDILTITTPSAQQKQILISIYNMQGQEMISSLFQNKNTIALDVSALAKGIYLVQVQRENRIVKKKLIVL